MQEYLQCGRFRLPLTGDHFKPLVMGVLNVTPDSFSDGGRFASLESALSRAEQMIASGADIIDIGGESSRPGAMPVPLDEELSRVMPVLHVLRDCGTPLSVDTYKPEVMREAIAAGADMINDIRGFSANGALSAIKNGDCALCIMHMQNTPQSMQSMPQYQDVLAEVIDFFRIRVATMRETGIQPARLCVDPGFGFGKTLEHNLLLLQGIPEILASLDLPLLAGLSRKSMIGAMTGKPVEGRIGGSLAAALAAAAKGAKILRVHDVAETVDALRVWQLIWPK